MYHRTFQIIFKKNIKTDCIEASSYSQFVMIRRKAQVEYVHNSSKKIKIFFPRTDSKVTTFV